jgi:hypothetical protein
MLVDISTMQADSELGVKAGEDGVLGTFDDETECSASCPQKYAKYFTYVGLLEPRQDAGGNPLPPAFDVVADKLRSDLHLFIPKYIETIERISSKLNGPLTLASDGLDLEVSDLDYMFAPMRDWVDQITTIDYQTLVQAVVPAWILRIDNLLDSVGVSVDVPSLVKLLFQPVIDEISAAVEEHVVARARTYLETLTAQYHAQVAAIRTEINSRLDASAPTGLGGNALDYVLDSGLWVHSFNIAAAALAKHEIVLPNGDELGGLGPATFDGSYTPTWMQAGVCEYLRKPIFPLGTDMKALLSVHMAGTDYVANLDDDSPVECHDGSLSSFTTSPSATNCGLVGLQDLQVNAIGSLSRSFPPSTVGRELECLNIEVPGLPKPPVSADPDAGVGGTDAGTDDRTPAKEGCCASGDRGNGNLWLVLLVAAVLGLRRRHLRRLGLMLALAFAAGCPGRGESAAVDAGSSIDADSVAIDAGDQADANENTADAGVSPRARLLAALGNSTWHGTHVRDGKERGFELQFRASSLLWAEIRNPYGPGRHREMRAFTVEQDGRTASSTVIVPGGWPPNPDNGRQDEWTIEVIDGTPRRLRTTRNGVVEEFEEGPWPEPTSGLTAIVYSFAPSMGIDNAFCDSGVGGFNYPVLFAGARGTSGETLLGVDVVAGAPLMSWSGGSNFAVTDVAGFNRLGGTHLSSQSNFVVRYIGSMDHGGGTLRMRELDDSVEDGVWVFLGDDVGSDSTADLFLEVHGFAWSEYTPDEPSRTLPAGPVPIEAILYRCTEPVTPVDVQIDTGSGWKLVGESPSSPVINDELFPPAF